MPNTPRMVFSSLSPFSPSFEVGVIIWYGDDKKPIKPSAPHSSAPLWESSDFLMLDELKIIHPFFFPFGSIQQNSKGSHRCPNFYLKDQQLCGVEASYPFSQAKPRLPTKVPLIFLFFSYQSSSAAFGLVWRLKCDPKEESILYFPTEPQVPRMVLLHKYPAEVASLGD